MTISLTVFVILFFFIILGVPVAMCIGIAGIAGIYIFNINMSFSTIASKFFSGVNSYTLLAIPFFIFAGEVMNKAGITKKVLDLADAFVGSLKGGLTYVSVVAAMFMATISGSGSACAAALGTSLIPEMEERGYSREYAVALTTCANVVGPIIPPSSVFILYAFYTGESVIRLFIGGVLPGVCIGIALMAVGRIICKVKGYHDVPEKFSWKKVGRALSRGWVALFVPAFLFISIVAGWCTATEAGALVCIMALIVGVGYGNIRSFRELMDIAISSAKSTCIIYALLAFSGIFSTILVRAHFTELISALITSVATTQAGVLLIIIAFMFFLGMFVDVTPMVTMFAVAFSTVAISVGVDSLHFGVLFVVIVMVGALTPPVGSILFVATTIGKTSMVKVIPILIPLLMTVVTVTILLIFIPELCTFLPNLLLG